MEPLVSVIIPTYRRKDGLIRAIKSVMSQTYSNWEIIVIDDNGNARYSKEVKRLLDKFDDKRICYLKNDKNIGSSRSRNRGILASNANYVAFLDDDDVLLKDSLELRVKKILDSHDNKLALVYGWVKSVSSENSIVTTYEYRFKGNCIKDALYDCIAATSQWLCKKQPLIDVGMFPVAFSQEDSLLIIKLLENGYTVDYVPKIINIYYNHPGIRISASGIRNLKGMIHLRNVVRKDYSLIDNKDIKKIEIHLTSQILSLAVRNKMWYQSLKETIHLLKYSRKEVIKGWLRPILRK